MSKIKVTNYNEPIIVEDQVGNKYICLNSYEAKAVANLIEVIRTMPAPKGGEVQLNTGDWFYDVPSKIRKVWPK